MESEASAAELVAHVDPEVDRIDGLITVTAREGSVLGLVTSRFELPTVRQHLIGLGVPDGMLELRVVGEASIPYPVKDDRLARWLEEAGESGTMDAAVTVKGPSIGMTPRRIVVTVILVGVGLYIVLAFLSTLGFILLTVLERLAGS